MLTNDPPVKGEDTTDRGSTPAGPPLMVRRFHRRTVFEMSLSRRVAFSLPLLALAASVRAETWPTKPLRLVVPYPAGGPTDVLARALAAKMGEGLGQQIVVDNKPGGAGNIGSDIGAK